MYQQYYRLGDNPNPIPGSSTNPDTSHQGDNWISNTVSWWTQVIKDTAGGAFSGLGKGLADGFGVSETTAWLIAGGLVLYLVTQKKGRR